jgi:hypothetical protein
VLVQKKGQITIFILVGIVLLLGIAGFFMFRSSSVRDTFEQTSQQLIVEKVSSEFRPVQQFTSACVKEISKDGLQKIGFQGGYAYGDQLVANKLQPTSNADSLMYWPGDAGTKIAYWWYMDSPDSCSLKAGCTFNTKQPALTGSRNSIESNLEEYIKNELPTCLNDFNALSEQNFDIVSRGDIEADVTIGEKAVYVQVDYPLDATKDNKNQVLNFYTAEIDVSLYDMYAIASDITKLQAEQAFLEEQIIELISLYSGTRRDAMLPPFYDPAVSKLGGDNRWMWTRTEVKKSLMSILASYVPMFSIIESGNFQFVNSDETLDMAFFDKMILSVNTTGYFNYDVTFDYKNWWDMYLNIGGSEIIQPDSNEMPILGDLPLIGNIIEGSMPLNYQFGYDISYPVLVSISDPRAFDGEGFSLKFALESNVRSNAPLPSGSDPAPQQGLPSSFYQSIYCTDDNFASAPIKVEVKDAIARVPIEGAEVEYTCVRDSCRMGLTREQDDGVYLETQYPICLNGILEVSKIGYQPKSIPVSTAKGEDVSLPVIELYPLQDIDIQARVFGRVKRGGSWSFNWNPVDLREAESFLITFERIKEEEYESDFSLVTYLEGPDDKETISLIPGEYIVTGQLVFDTTVEGDGVDEIVIPEETREYGGFLGFGEERVTLEEVRFGEYFPEGLIVLDDEHGGPWDIDEVELANTDTITFYVIASPYLEPGLQLNFDDMEEFGKADYFTGVHRSLIEPCLGDDRCE